eukprot:COSAG01_NODE_3148_length_6514_cov_194.153079_4_plen_78_part_00
MAVLECGLGVIDILSPTVTPRNASLGLWRLYCRVQLHYDGVTHAPRDERPIAARPRGRRPPATAAVHGPLHAHAAGQ